MASVVDKYNKELTALLNKNGGTDNLVENTIKHFFCNTHNMIMEDLLFCQPDLCGLEKYENWLNEGNKKR